MKNLFAYHAKYLFDRKNKIPDFITGIVYTDTQLQTMIFYDYFLKKMITDLWAYHSFSIWAIPRKVTYTLHKKRQLVGQSIKEGE